MPPLLRVRVRATLSLAFCLFFFTASFAQAVSYGVNLIANGNAEAGSSSASGNVVMVPSWATTGGFTVIPYSAGNGYPGVGDPGPADRANQFFAGGNNVAQSTAQQIIDLSANSTDINTGNVAYDLSGWFGGFSSDPDHASLVATFYNGATNLGSVTAGPVTAKDRNFATGFVMRETAGRVPVNTTRVILTQIMVRNNGSSNDGYADSLSLVLTLQAAPPTVVNSTFAGNGTRTDATANWSSASHWSPMTAPNNTVNTSYNATITGLTLTVPLQGSPGVNYTRTFGEVRMDTDATVGNFTLSTAGIAADGLVTNEHSLTILGTTSDQTLSQPSLGIEDPGFVIRAVNNDVLFSLGTFANFSGTTLSSTRISLTSNGPSATMLFNGADIVTLNTTISLTGALANIVDENGNDALRHLATISQGGSLAMISRVFTTAGNLTVDGGLFLQDFSAGSTTTFTINGNLTNFDSVSRTLNGSNLGLTSMLDAGVPPTVTLKFNGADIVNNGGSISLTGANAQIRDQNNSNGLRNFAHNLTNGTLFFTDVAFTTAGAFTNDGIMTLRAQGAATSFTINGSLTNFDSTSRTLLSGQYRLFGSSSVMAATGTLRFNGADIVHNAALLAIGTGASIRDEMDRDGLRNFVDNQASGDFELEGQSFAAPSDFTNAGIIRVENFDASQIFSVPAGHAYTQTGGETDLGDGSIFTAPTVSIQGGIFHNGGIVNGNVTVVSGTLAPTGFGGGGIADFQSFIVVVPGTIETPGPADMQINGNLSLQDNAQLSFVINGTDAGSFDTMEVSGNTHFAGKLAVTLLNGFVPQSTDSFTVLTGGSTITGAFANVASGSRILTNDGRGSFIATYSNNKLVLSNFTTEPPHGLLNLSTRVRVLTDDNIAIAGFIITGTETKRVLIRGIGPSLTQRNLNGVLADPTLELHTTDANNQDMIVASNDNWQDDSVQATEIQNDGLAPPNAAESAIVISLAPGRYTVLLRGKNRGTGIGLVELYDVESKPTAKLANLSTRGFVDTCDNVMIGGFVVGLSDGAFRTDPITNGALATTAVVVRAIGPSLPTSIANRLQDPFVTLYDANGAAFASNDDWQSDPNAAPVQSDNLAPVNPKESAILLHLAPGVYTAIVRGTNNTTGVGLVEIYRE